MSNTVVRILVSIISIPLILGVCVLGGMYFVGFTLLIGGIAFYEFISFSKKKETFGSFVIGLPAVVVFILNAYFKVIEFLPLLYIIVILALLLELFRNKASAILNVGVTLLGIFYIAAFTGALVLLREYFVEYQRGAALIISVLATIWICDSAAYFFGLSFGKHRLFLRVSPKKSWEGAIAGFIFSLFAMLAAKYFVLNFLSWIDVFALGFIVGTMGQIGDLIESLLKRDAGVKDSSALIPGHGGIFDRFDSLMYVAPIIFLYTKYFIAP